MRYSFSGFLGVVLTCSTLYAKPLCIRQALAAFDKEDFTQAQALIDQATTAPTTSTQAATWYYRGAIYEKLLRNQIATDEAPELFATTLAAYHKVLSLAPQASQYHSFAQINLRGLWTYYLDRGRRYYKQEAFENAIEQFAYCQKIRPEAPWATLYTAIAAHQEQLHDVALTHYRHYLASGKAVSPLVYRSLAHLIAHHCQDTEQALSLLDQGLCAYPLDNGLLYERLQLLTQLGRADEAYRVLKEALSDTPHQAVTHYQLGYWYEYHGQYEAAHQHYQQAITLAPARLEPARQQGALCYNQAAQMTQTMAAMPDEEFEQHGPALLKALDEYLRLALPCFEQASKIDKRNVFVLQHLSTLYQRLSKPAKAQKAEAKLANYQDAKL